jgi:hypothetical protein
MAFNFRPPPFFKKPNLFNLSVPHVNEFSGLGGALSTPSFHPNEFPSASINPWHGQQSDPDRAFFPESGNIEYYYDSRAEDEGGSWRGYRDAPTFERTPFLPIYAPEAYGNLGQGDQNQLGKMPAFKTQEDIAQLKAEEIRQAEIDRRKYEKMMELATMGDDRQATAPKPQMVGAGSGMRNFQPIASGPLKRPDDILNTPFLQGLYS